MALMFFDPMPPDARARQPLAQRVIERVALMLGALPPRYISPGYGVTFRSVGNRRQAIKVFTRLTKRDREHPERWLFMRAATYVHFDMPQKALDDYDKAVGPGGSIRSTSDLVSRGTAHLDLGHFDLAIRDYTEAVEIYLAEPDRYPEGYFFRAQAYASVGRFDEAIEDLNKLLSEDKIASVYCYRGRILLEIGDGARASMDFDEAIRLAPNEAWVYMRRAEAYLGRQNELALESFREALWLSSERRSKVNTLGQEKEIAREAREAIRRLSKWKK